jgi:hypothetical protein
MPCCEIFIKMLPKIGIKIVKEIEQEIEEEIKKRRRN